jgi:hypothetical protein
MAGTADDRWAARRFWAGIVASIVLLAAVFAASVAGCSLVQSCEDQGCGPSVSITTPLLRVDSRALTVRACINDLCAEERYGLGRSGEFADGTVAMAVPDTDEVAVRVTLIDAAGRVLADARGTGIVEHERPNGDDCPPECRILRVRIDGSRLVPSSA